MLTMAKLILNNTEEYNGHKRLTLSGVTLSLQDICLLLRELEDEYEGEYPFIAQVWEDGSIGIYQKDYYEDREDKDRLVLSVEK